MTDIIFVTCNEMPELTPSDAVAAAALRTRGVSVTAAPWNGDQAAFADADLIVMRSAWDYPAHHQAFERWLGNLSDDKRVVNDPALMRWNLSKRYLLDLAQKGAPLPPTRAIRPEAGAIADAMDDLGLERAVVKPLMGATGSGLSLVERGGKAGLEAAAEKLGMDGLVQALIPEITTMGETSMMFFAGEYSHAVTKRPAAGEILCQEEHGGATEAVNPPESAIEEARRILAMVPGAPLYARVDAILPGAGILDESLRLMEVELIEPELFFPYAPPLGSKGAADAFAAAVMNKLNEVK